MWTITRQQEPGGLRVVEVTNGEVGEHCLPAWSVRVWRSHEYAKFNTKEEAMVEAEKICKIWIEATKNQPGYVPQIKVVETEEPQNEEIPSGEETTTVEEEKTDTTEKQLDEPKVDKEEVKPKRTRRTKTK